MMRISIYMQDGNKINSFLQSDRIELYKKDEGWTLDKIIQIPKPIPTGMGQLRDWVKQFIQELDGCTIIAGGELSGIPYSVFKQMRFSIFDIQEFTPSVLDEIVEDIQRSDEQKRYLDEIIKNAAPVETETPGIYYLDLVALQTECPTVSSKKALKSFLGSTPFLELKLICRHIPPWLENGCYGIQSQQTGNGNISAVITKKNC